VYGAGAAFGSAEVADCIGCIQAVFRFEGGVVVVEIVGSTGWGGWDGVVHGRSGEWHGNAATVDFGLWDILEVFGGAPPRTEVALFALFAFGAEGGRRDEMNV